MNVIINNSILYVFLGNSNHPMAYITLERLYECGFFTSQNCLIITDTNNGQLCKLGKDKSFVVNVIKSNEELFQLLKNSKFNYLISCGWGHKISKDILCLAKVASINSHNAFLPDYKGMAPYKHVWANAEDYSGITVHIMDENLDTGNILTQQKVKIYWWETPRTILLRISEHAPSLIMLAIEKYNNGFRGLKDNSTRGRYFLKTSNISFILHRVYNLIAKKTGFKRKHTKHK